MSLSSARLRFTSSGGWAAATWLGLLVTLVLLPFEDQLPLIGLGPIQLTAVELPWLLTIAIWIGSHLANRSYPRRIPLVLLVAFVVMTVGGAISAILADGQNWESFRFMLRTTSGLLLFAVVVDLVRNDDQAGRVGVVLLVGVSVAAALGIVVQVGAVGSPLASMIGRTYLVAGVLRLSATFDYPNTAAMAFEMATFVALALFGTVVTRKRRGRWAVVAAVVLLSVAMLLTLSRGATIGTGAGLLVLAALAAHAHRGRVVAGAVAGICGLVAFTVVVQLASLPIDRLFSESDRSFYGASYNAPSVINTDADGRARTSVTVTNTGATTWNALRLDEYALGYRWLDTSGAQTRVLGDGQAPIGSSVAPGQSVTVGVIMLPPEQRASWVLGWDMVHSNVAWFSDRGVPVGTSRMITATPAASGQSRPPSSLPPTIVLYPDLQEPSRAQLWGVALQMFSRQPLLGVGPGTYRLRYGSYLGLTSWSAAIHSNNLYLELAATTGIVGLSSFLAGVGYVLWRAFRSVVVRPGTSFRPWLVRAMLVGAVVSFLAHGFVDYFLGFNATSGVFWGVLGISFALSES